MKQGDLNDLIDFEIEGGVLVRYKGSRAVVTIPDCVESIGYGAFFCSRIKSVTIPGTVTTIGEQAFHLCTDLINVNILTGVMKVDKLAFAQCSSLTSITIPDSVKEVGSRAFFDCDNLRSIILSAGVEGISQAAFDKCNSLERIIVEGSNKVYHSEGNCLIETKTRTLVCGCKSSVIPDDESVTKVGESAFYGCSSLKSIKIPKGVTSIGDYAFV